MASSIVAEGFLKLVALAHQTSLVCPLRVGRLIDAKKDITNSAVVLFCTPIHDKTMPSQPIDLLAVYLHLAKAAWKRLRMQDRDRLLVISGFISAKMNLPRISGHCRKLILENNPGHMIRRWADFDSALDDSDFQHFLKQIQRRFPQEKAEVMLSNLGIDRANEHALYSSDEEYAAAVIGVDFSDDSND